MEAVLPIYNSIQDKEPCKVYTCYRTTIAINNKLEELTDETNTLYQQINKLAEKVTDETPIDEVKKIKEAMRPLEEKASQLTYESILLFFPELTVEEFEKLDPNDYQLFVLDIGKMRNVIYSRAQKN